MDYNSIIKEKEESIKQNVLPIFIKLSPKEKIIRIKRAIEQGLVASKKANYYQGLKSADGEKSLEQQYEEDKELTCNLRVKMELQTLDDSELHLFLDMLEERIDKIRNGKLELLKQGGYDFVTKACTLSSGVGSDVFKSTIADIRNTCEEFLEGRYLNLL